MVFSSHIFLFYFLPIVFIGYYILVKLKVNISWVNLYVTVGSYVFYGWCTPSFVFLMFITSYTNYICGKFISAPDSSEAKRKFWLIISCVVSLGFLGYFKYFMFVLGGINHIVELFGGGEGLFRTLSVTLPIGISFYTFQAMSYTIDVYRKDAPPVKDMRTFSCFVALFPQLIAGPIVRYNTVAEQLEVRTHTVEKFNSGMALFILGFAKKILLANAGGEVANMVFRAESPGVLASWWGALGYHFQIYFDFCAYSDMAVGLGRMMGFEFIKNFNAPYISQSISDFWNRWHISLSTWIRDYLYIGLGGNRKGPTRTYINLGIAMFLCGMWHGAQMTFVVWGVFHGGLLIWERTMSRQPIYKKLPVIPKIIITQLIVMTGWVIFRAPSISQAFQFIGYMYGFREAAPSAALLNANVFSLKHIVGMLLCAIAVWQPFQAHDWVDRLSVKKYILLIVLFVYAIIGMFTQAFNPFLYFQF